MRMLRILGSIVGSVVLLAAVAAVGVNTQAGHRAVERIARLAGLEITGLEGRFPDDFSIAHATLADADGVWLEIEGLRLNWWPTALLRKDISATLLAATRIHVARYPKSSGTSSSSSLGGFDYRVAVDAIKADRIELPEATLSLEGRAVYQTSGMDVSLSAISPDAAGQGPAALKATLIGPLNAVATKATIDAKGLTTRLDGTLDIVAIGADLRLAIDQPDIAGVKAGHLDATVKGNADAATVHAVLAGLKLPGDQPDLLGDGPVTLDAVYQQSTTPEITATLTAGASAADGLRVAADAGYSLVTQAIRLNLTVERLMAADVAAGKFTLQAEGDAKALDMHSTLAGLVVPGVASEMLGTAPLRLDVLYRQGGVPELSATVQGDTATLTATGALPTERLALDYHLILPKLAAFSPAIAGKADLAGQIAGAFDNFAIKTKAVVDVTAQGASSTITGDIDATGLPSAPVGTALVKGSYAGQPVALAVNAGLDGEKRTRIEIAEATWQGLVAKGAFTLAEDGGLPTGGLTLEAARLPAPARAGAAKATIEVLRDGATPVLKVMAEVTRAAVEGASIARLLLNGTVTDPAGVTPALTASLVVDGAASGAYRQNARLDVTGPANALAIRVGVTGTASLSASATLDAQASRLNIASLQGTAPGMVPGQALRLAAPTTLTYAPQITLGATRITLGGSALDIVGRLAPTLDVTASLRAVPAELARLIDPQMQAEGSLQAQARLQGTTTQPTGTVQLSGTGLRLRQPNGIPAMRLNATAALQGNRARINATLAAGATELVAAGSVPISPGWAYDLAVRGRADLALLDPFLASAGAQTRGSLALDARLTGTEPRPSGTLTLHRGTFAVPGQGVRLSEIEAVLRAAPDRVVIETLTARAGSGTLFGTGNVGLAAPMPVQINLVARDASPLSSDLIKLKFDADLGLSGALQTAMAATGTIRIARAEINIPQRLPASLPVLAIRQPGPPPPPPPPEVPIDLDITLTAADQIFVRGRGLDAELGGKLHIGGTAAAPKPEGGFTLRRGQFSLAGQTLNFTTGRVSFDGHLPVDPTLDFAATTLTSKLAATLTINGNASHPRVSLSSVPSLPQDEVMAQLLFRRSASELGPLQLAQIAAGLAQIADVGGSAGFDPLGRLRSGLGLDVLSVGGAPGAKTSVEAGRTIFKGVYIGAKQSTSGTGSQATVRVDLAPGLRLEADVGVAPSPAANPTPGSPPTGNQIGVTYEFDY